MLHRLTINAAGLSAYLKIVARDPAGYLDINTRRGCYRLSATLGRLSALTDHASMLVSRVRCQAAAALSVIRWERALTV